MSDCDHTEEWLVSFLPFGHEVHAHPKLNMNAVAALHDLMHLMLARAMGRQYSIAMYRAAGIVIPETEAMIAAEEAAVLAFQQFVQMAVSYSETDLPMFLAA